MSKDIKHILDSWPYDDDEDVNVRIIHGDDGDKLQMRIDMGIIQMELDGNPTGDRPSGFESWFEYYQNECEAVESNAVDDLFSLDETDCNLIRAEAVRYYYRYLSLMKLGDYTRVIRDTDRNRRVFEFVKKYASSEMDRWALDQYRPYVIMMNTRAKVSLAIREFAGLPFTPGKKPEEMDIDGILQVIDKGIGGIVQFYEEYGLSSEMDSSVELAILKALKRELLSTLPLSLEEQLDYAIKEERFEDAAILRDRIRSKNKDD